MNWDTNELWLWITNEIEMETALKPAIGNELYFQWILYNIVTITNRKLEEANRIDETKVNGNEIYKQFCELNGNENEPCW